MTLTKILTAAVRIINVGRDATSPLKKIAEFGNADQGAGVYRDADYGEYRVVHIADSEHLHRADYHTSDKQDALDSAERFILPKHAGELADTGAEARIAELEEIEQPLHVVRAGNGGDFGMAEYEELHRLRGTVPETDVQQPARSRPRGYHSHPSPLLKGLLMRGPQ